MNLNSETILLTFGDSWTVGDGAGYTNSTAYNIIGTVSTVVVDSPATTSSVTYKVQFMSAGGTSLVRVQTNSSLSTIVLMEIAG